MPRKPKAKACKCQQRDGVHEVTCPAYDIDAEIDGDVRAPDLVAAATHSNGSGATTDVERMDDDDDEDDAKYNAVVDGDEAIIDPTPAHAAALVPRPSRDELLDALLRARRAWSHEKMALELQKSKFKVAQMSIDAIVAELATSWEERNQLELPLAGDPTVRCANCGLSAPTLVPVGMHDESWCVPCVQANLIPNGRSALAHEVAEAASTTVEPPETGAGDLGPTIYALAAALRFEDVAEWADVEALASDPRPTKDIAAVLSHIAGQNFYSISKVHPFVHKVPAEDLAPV